MSLHKSTSGIISYASAICLIVCGILFPVRVSARPADYYASSSRLASGRWAKIHVERTGIQFVSKSTLASLGFNDPSKVNAYGYGGAPISDNLKDFQPDDLPQLPTVHTPQGIYFFGRDRYRRIRNSASESMTFSHAVNPYSDDSWFFLSDIETEESVPASAETAADAQESLDTFTEFLVYEKDLVAPSNTGRVLLGEDFRSPTSRTFIFQLPDNADGTAKFRVAFATNTSSGSSSLSFQANGQKIGAQSSDIIAALTSADQFMRYATMTRTATNAGNNLQLQITYKGGGTVLMARLDYIEVEYARSLRLADGQLYFSHTSQTASVMNLEGCTEGTVVWDVTDPSDTRAVSLQISGGKGHFTAPAGYREYVAFTPSVSGYACTRGEKVSNQDIHGLESPDMLIVTPREYLEPARRLAAMHERQDSLKVAILYPEDIYNEFSSGTPDVSSVRKLLKMWYDRSESGTKGRYARYCLLMSRPTFDHKTASRKASWPLIPIWLSYSGTSQTTSYSTDDFMGMLSDDQQVSTSFNIGQQKIQTSVGRLAVTSLEEADRMVDKIIKYVEKPETGSWRNHVLIIADDQDNGVHFEQAEKVYGEMTGNGNGGDFLYERLYLDTYDLVASSKGNTYPAAKERLLKLWDEGLMYINYIGHASPKEWGHEDLLNWIDINAFSNTRLPFLYAATCEFNRWDADDRSGAEVLWLYPSSGIIATICPSRTVYINQNGILNTSTHKTVFEKDNYLGKRIGDIMRDGKNGVTSVDDNKLRYALLGDPAMRIPSPSGSVKLDSISGVDVTRVTDDIVLPALGKSRMSGRVLNARGELDTSFNGLVYIQIYDAEKPIETKGNGDNGVVKVYNDRKIKLYSGSCRAKGGLWSTTVLMPSEIENNYSPARIVFYASSDSGAEANGSFSSFYVYGYDQSAAEDTEGPEISMFALNREDFADGGLVHATPVALASFSDESGINLSDAGIGHKMMLQLDGKTSYEDVNSYYTPDPDDITAGSVAYPLPELEAGEHTLKLTVWDNVGNSSSRQLTFSVGVAMQPAICDLTTDVNPAREQVNFLLTTDRPMSKLECRVEVFDLNGRTVWRSDESLTTDMTSAMSVVWDLRDSSGVRVPRGIYLYRATVITDEGTSTTASRKLAVAAQ